MKIPIISLCSIKLLALEKSHRMNSYLKFAELYVHISLLNNLNVNKL